ncbi:MAG: hypothetical protein GWP08_00580 [Nitrospiraceae bacterium]|nr:hypothetical protein [Nitrospiraceae bacterium]
MRAMTLLGSPRKKGNTAQLLEVVEATLRTDGHDVDRANVVDYDYGGCRECYGCKQGEFGHCIVEDDANGLLDRALEADVIVLAAPVFSCGFPAEMKALLDRMFCLVGPEQEDGACVTKLSGKRIALVMTLAGPMENNGDIMVRAFDTLVEFMAAKHAGHLILSLCQGPSSIDETVRAEAVEFARGLFD